MRSGFVTALSCLDSSRVQRRVPGILCSSSLPRCQRRGTRSRLSAEGAVTRPLRLDAPQPATSLACAARLPGLTAP